MSEGEYCGRLALGVGVDRIGLDAKADFEQSLYHIDRLPDAWRDEVLEHCNVVVGHVSVRHGPHLAIAEVVAGQ